VTSPDVVGSPCSTIELCQCGVLTMPETAWEVFGSRDLAPCGRALRVRVATVHFQDTMAGTAILFFDPLKYSRILSSTVVWGTHLLKIEHGSAQSATRVTGLAKQSSTWMSWSWIASPLCSLQ
jgi:hypothetical protein